MSSLKIAKLFCEKHNVSPQSIIEMDGNVSVVVPTGVNPENPLVVCTAKDINDLLSAAIQGWNKDCPESDMAMFGSLSKFPYEVQEHLMKLLNMKGSDFDIDNAKAVLINIVDVPAFEAYIYRRGITFYAGAVTSDGKKQYFYR